MISMTHYDTFRIKNIKDEAFQDYKKVSMLISTAFCDWKCCLEQNRDKTICQNSKLSEQPIINYSIEKIYNRYIQNELTKAVVIAGFEPFVQPNELLSLIKYFRDNGCNDDIVIYTGYYENEISDMIDILKEFPNIIIKFGRYIINSKSRFDDVLGVTLSSENQYAKKIS